MSPPLTRDQIIRLLSQHPVNPKVLFKEEPPSDYPASVMDLREKPDGVVEAIFYPGFFHIPSKEQREFLTMALKYLDKLFQKLAMVRMAKNLLQMESNMNDKDKPEIDPSIFDDDHHDDDHHDDSHSLGMESPAAPLPSLEDFLRENQQFKELVDSLKKLQNENPDKVLLIRNFNIYKEAAMQILESFVGLSLSRISPELVTQLTNQAILCIQEMVDFHHQLINLTQREQDQT